MDDRNESSRLPERRAAAFLDGDGQEIQLPEIRERKTRERGCGRDDSGKDDSGRDDSGRGILYTYSFDIHDNCAYLCTFCW
jgi:hypothetical protein